MIICAYFYAVSMEINVKLWYNYHVRLFLRRYMFMTKKKKIVIAASISAAIILVGTAAVGFAACKKIYQKKYFNANY